MGRLNADVYGTDFPPDYDAGAVTTPVSIYYSLNDRIADPTVNVMDS